MTPESLPQSLRERITVDAGGCWLWSGAHGAARRVYVFLVGPIAEGMELHRRCYRKACVNPVHLAPVTHAESMRLRALKPSTEPVAPPEPDLLIHMLQQVNLYRVKRGLAPLKELRTC